MKKKITGLVLGVMFMASVGVVNAANNTKNVLGGDYKLRAECTNTYAQSDVYAYNGNTYPIGSGIAYYTYDGSTYTVSLPGSSYSSYWRGSKTLSNGARFYKTTTKFSKNGTTYDVSASN